MLLSHSRVFLSTLSLRRATFVAIAAAHFYGISIHALLAESDGGSGPGGAALEISIHALLAESDGRRGLPVRIGRLFLSTLSLRRATVPGEFSGRPQENFYPRSPCGERQAIFVSSSLIIEFLSTLSLRRATADVRDSYDWDFISIHALLAESDQAIPAAKLALRYFYPRSPCGERRPHGQKYINSRTFLSTLSLRRATPARPTANNATTIFLSTLSLRRATPGSTSLTFPGFDFYPRSPCGERRQTAYFFLAGGGISIHALLAESDG